MRNRILCLLALLLGLSAAAQTAYDFSQLRMEDLGRGVIAVRQSPAEVFVTWRFLTDTEIARLKMGQFD